MESGLPIARDLKSWMQSSINSMRSTSRAGCLSMACISASIATTSAQPSIMSSNEAVFGIDHESDSDSRGWAGSLFQKESVESVILRA